MTEREKIEKEYLVDDITQDVAKMLMEDTSCDIASALSTIYNSKTYEKLCNEKTGLYYQSPVYVYEFLKEELNS